MLAQNNNKQALPQFLQKSIETQSTFRSISGRTITIPDENAKTSSVTYWVPLLEHHYTYSSSWNLNDSTRYKYNSVPPALNGLINYQLKYYISSNQTYKDTFEYNSLGQQTLTKHIELGTAPNFTVWNASSYRYNSSNLRKGKTNYVRNWDFANCMGGGMGYKLMYSSNDTITYDANNHSLVNLGQTYNSSSCGWVNSWVDSSFRNASGLVTLRRSYNFSAGNWNPSSQNYFVYDAAGNLIKFYTFSYNFSTQQWDTAGLYKNITFYYYDKFELDNSIPTGWTYMQYDTSTNTYTNVSKWETSYDSYGNFIKSISYTWNGSSFDTSNAFIRNIYYHPLTTTGQIDSIITLLKSGASNPFVPMDKYIYPSGMNVTGIKDYSNSHIETYIYPNPATDVLYIKSEDKIKNIIITDIQGRSVISMKGNDELMLAIPVNNIEAGVYFIKLQLSNGSESYTKIIKQ